MTLNLLQSPEPAVDRDGAPGYEAFFGLSRNPFAPGPDPKVFFHSDSHANALEILQHEIGRNGVMVLTGERGTGKTTLCQVLADRDDCKAVTALVSAPETVDEELLTAVLQEFGVMSRANSVGRAPTSTELTNTLRDFLRSLASLDAYATLIIDEAHRLSPAMLPRLANLLDEEIDTTRRLHIVLMGEPALIATLQSPDARPLDRRVAVRCQLKPLAEAEVPAYVAHRLTLSGAPSARIFSPAALRLIYAHSGGIPRQINALCDRALLAAHATQSARVDKNLVASAAGELGLAPTAPTSSFFRRVLGRLRQG